MQQANDQEPIFWLSSKDKAYTGASRVVRDSDGEPVRDHDTGVVVRERVPARAPGAAERFETVVRADGHVISMVLTNAAAQVDGDTSFKKYMREKQRHFGWFRLSVCPVLLFFTGQLSQYHIRDKRLLETQPCRGQFTDARPCPHALAERDARQHKHAAGEVDRMRPYQAEADKILGEQQKMNRELVADVAHSVGASVAEAVVGAMQSKSRKKGDE